VADDVISAGARASDRNEAIAALFEAEYPRLVNIAFAFVRDWDVSEQLAQEAYLRLWRAWWRLRDAEAAPAYLRQTVVNLSRNTIRRRMVERRVLGGWRAADDVPDHAGDIVLRHAIAELPDRKRACVVLRYLVGMTEAETAAALGISPGTVKSQTHKALRQLRELLREPAGSPLGSGGNAP
jgi:RNA polymerase sigma-70 factor (sigma-E family)